MKKIFILLLFCKSTLTEGQNIDASIFGIHRTWNNTTTVLSWTTLTKGNFSLQARTNFDAHNTVALIPGKILKIKKIIFVPECGILIGDYKSISPEFYSIIPLKKVGIYLFGQYSIGMSKENQNFLYTYGQILYLIHGIKIGIGAQFFKNTSVGNITFMDIGPQIKIPFLKNYYVKPWPTIDPINKWRIKLIAGIGISF